MTNRGPCLRFCEEFRADSQIRMSVTDSIEATSRSSQGPDLSDFILSDSEKLGQKLKAHNALLLRPSSRKILRKLSSREVSGLLGITDAYLRQVTTGNDFARAREDIHRPLPLHPRAGQRDPPPSRSRQARLSAPTGEGRASPADFSRQLQGRLGEDDNGRSPYSISGPKGLSRPCRRYRRTGVPYYHVRPAAGVRRPRKRNVLCGLALRWRTSPDSRDRPQDLHRRHRSRACECGAAGVRAPDARTILVSATRPRGAFSPVSPTPSQRSSPTTTSSYSTVRRNSAS